MPRYDNSHLSAEQLELYGKIENCIIQALIEDELIDFDKWLCVIQPFILKGSKVTMISLTLSEGNKKEYEHR